jgi:hypothetical protein
MFASLAAGPAFLASLALAQWASTEPTTYVMAADASLIGGGVMIGFVSLFFGFILSIAPNLVASWFMHGLGIGNFAARLPVAWALVGAGAAGLPFVFLPAAPSEFAALGTAFALTGASCGLVANRFSTWT